MLNWVKQVVVDTESSDDTKYPTSMIKYKGKTSNCLMLTPFGLYNNAPKGSGGIALTPSGIESNLWGIFQDFESRIKGLKPGEVVTGSPIHGGFIEYLSDGSVAIVTDHGKNIFNPDGSVMFSNGAQLDSSGDYISATGISLNNHRHVGNLGAPTGPAIP